MLYVIAIIGDICSLVPGLNIVTNVLTAMVLFMAGPHVGVYVFSSRNLGRTIGVVIAEGIPIISMFPFWTWRVHRAYKDAAAEEV